MERMQVCSRNSYITGSVQKILPVLRELRGKKADEALFFLKSTSKRFSCDLIKIIRAALASANEFYGKSGEDFFVANYTIGKGRSIKRIEFKGRSKMGRRVSCSSSVSIFLESI